MPLIRIDLYEGTSPEYREKLSNAIHRALVESLGTPDEDRFQIITQHGKSELVFDPHYIGADRSGNALFIQITLSVGRKLEQKRNLYKKIVENVHQSVGIRPDDVVIVLHEVAWENWSFGNALAHYAL